MASVFDKLQTALIEEATSPTNSATEAEDVQGDLDNDACSSAASALPKMEEFECSVASTTEAEDAAPSNLDAALSAEVKAEPVTLTPLRLPIPQREAASPSRDDYELVSSASSSTSIEEAEAAIADEADVDCAGASATVVSSPSRKQVLRLGDGLIQLPPLPHQHHQAQRQHRRQPKLGSSELPTLGSAGHHMGGCKPCAFAHTKGCENGINCNFCHLCEPGEKKRRQKRRMMTVACQVEARLKEAHQQQQQAAAAAAATAMSPVMCRPMMSSPVVSRPVMLPASSNWVASPGACSPGGVSSAGSNAWPVGSPATPHCANTGTWSTVASPPANNAVGGAWPVAASPSANNTVGGWQSPQLRMAAVFSIF